MRVHARLKRILHVFIESICRHRNDRDALRVRTIQLTDAAGRGESIHERHADIHQDRVIGINGAFSEHIDCELSIHRAVSGNTLKLKQVQKDLRV